MGNNIDKLSVTPSELEKFLADDTVIEGGHYVAGKPVDECTAWTWNKAVSLYRRGLDLGLNNIALSILVDDLALEPAARKAFRDEYRLPARYLEVLMENHVSERNIRVTWEAQLRNRAGKDLKKRRIDVTKTVQGSFVSCSDLSFRQLSSEAVPLCNLLMAKYTAEKNVVFSRAINLYDWIWEHESEGGVIVSRELYNTKIEVYNVYVIKPNEILYLGLHRVE